MSDVKYAGLVWDNMHFNIFCIVKMFILPQYNTKRLSIF